MAPKGRVWLPSFMATMMFAGAGAAANWPNCLYQQRWRRRQRRQQPSLRSLARRQQLACLLTHSPVAIGANQKQWAQMDSAPQLIPLGVRFGPKLALALARSLSGETKLSRRFRGAHVAVVVVVVLHCDSRARVGAGPFLAPKMSGQSERAERQQRLAGGGNSDSKDAAAATNAGRK